jgi:translation initiation factor eIF-2B subunit delta
MVVPTIADPPVNYPGGNPSQKSMTKAERRELQEKQRAAKAALKQPQQQGKTSQPTQAKSPQTPQATKKETQQSKQPQQVGGGSVKTKAPATPRRKSFLAESPWKGALKDANAVSTEDPAIMQSHGLRIFSHFGQPKPVVQVKGDIHPSIIRLGLLFSEFKIVGANARCIATLTAFQQVSSIMLFPREGFESAIGDPRLHYTPE